MTVPPSFPRLRAEHINRFRIRFSKFASLTIIVLFFVANGTGLFLKPVLAPSVSAATVLETIPLDIPATDDCDLDWLIYRTGEREGVDPRFIHAVIRQESHYDPHAVSPAGARGLMQLMPDTAKRFGTTNPDDEEQNVEAGTKYLAWLLKRFDGDVSLTLAGYNAGEGAVDRFNGVPPYDETQHYVKTIVANYGKRYHPVLTPEDARLMFHLASARPID